MKRHALIHLGVLAALSAAEARPHRFLEGAPLNVSSHIPAEGLLEAELREAKTTEVMAIIELVQGALRAKLYPADSGRSAYVKALYPTQAIVRAESGRYQSYPYVISEDNRVTLGEPSEVVEEYAPVVMREAAEVLIEAKGEAKEAKFLIRVIRAGLSKNRAYYSDEFLREATPMFNGTRVFVKSDEDHLAGRGKTVKNLIGGLTDAVFIEGKEGKDTGEVQAVLTLLNADDDIATKLREAIAKKMTELFGFSIDLLGKTITRMVESKPVRFALKPGKVNSVDLIVEPGAGGALVRLLEAADPFINVETDPMRKTLIAKIKKHLPAARVTALGDLDTIAEEKLLEAYNEAVAIEETQRLAEAAAAQSGSAAPATGVTQDQLREALAATQNQNAAILRVNGSSLPAAAKTRLLEAVGRQQNPQLADVDAMIKAEADYLAQFTEAGRVRGLGGIQVEDVSLKTADMLDAFFDPAHKNHRDVQSFKECYVAITGDKLVTGRIRDCDRSRMAEALGTFREAMDSTTLGDALGDSITRRMLADYRGANEFDGWRRCVSVVPLSDFRTQKRVRVGGYGDLEIVPESADYPDMSTPGDEVAEYAAAKRGGIERITLEAIKNDDVAVIRRLPTKISRAAKRTVAKFVFDFFRANAAIYDGDAFFHANHNNLLTTALDAGQLAAHRLLMLKQTELTSADRIGVAPRILLTPVDLQQTAVDLFKLNTNNERTFIQSLTMDIVVPWYWTDPNNFYTLADPLDIPTIEVGFLDGQEEPQLFIQDSPTSGSVFSNDQISWKVKHVYGGAVTDYRGATGGIVA